MTHVSPFVTVLPTDVEDAAHRAAPLILAASRANPTYLPNEPRTLDDAAIWFTSKPLDKVWVAHAQDGSTAGVIAACERTPAQAGCSRRKDLADLAVAPSMEACRLVVAPAWTRQGVGSLLVAQVGRCARYTGHELLWLQCVQGSSTEKMLAREGWDLLAPDTSAESRAQQRQTGLRSLLLGYRIGSRAALGGTRQAPQQA